MLIVVDFFLHIFCMSFLIYFVKVWKGGGGRKEKKGDFCVGSIDLIWESFVWIFYFIFISLLWMS